MAKLTLSTFTCPSADLGDENPHAALFMPYSPVAHYVGQDMPVDSCLPYRLQDGYSRELKDQEHKVAVLESDRLRATFLLDLGGRLWSLIHKPTARELLYVNPVIQFANFGIRNAWFSGGMEWNMGVFGHCVFTCSPVFAGRIASPFGGEGIRLWEYERIRGIVWQVDVHAPDGSDFLYVAPRLVNHHDREIPMYWWTCIAVEEEPGGRVLAPADYAIEPAHAMGEETVVHSLAEKPHLTYPQQRDLPRDTYFDIPEGERPWVAHISTDGNGVLHLSSPFLKGRKQWVWGMERCGRRWQDWLSPGGPPYIEIQGGLAKKQSDYIPMPAGADWSWLEAFGPMDGVDASGWQEGVESVKAFAARELPATRFLQMERAVKETQLNPPIEVLHTGAGWGRQAGACREETPFDGQPNQEFSSPSSVQDGIEAFASGDRAQARRIWGESAEVEPNGWALRSLAVLDKLEGDFEGACKRILEAQRLLSSDERLMDEAARMLFEAGQIDQLEAFLSSLPGGALKRPRLRLAAAQVALHRGDLNKVKSYFDSKCDLVDIREAETTVSDLWRGLCEKDPSTGDPAQPPWEWDFRMRRE